jgi:hypothetical protein
MTDPKDRLLELLHPVLAKVADLDPASCRGAEADRLLDALRESFPADGAHVGEIGTLVDRGVIEGWLCDRGEPGARFSRLAKPSPATYDLSIDVVSLEGPALEHTHPRGEITLGFTVEGDPRFDGHPAGWVFMEPGSTHTPTVSGGRMNLVYFLPGGSVEWIRG